MGNEVFSSSSAEAFRTLFRKHDETAGKIDHLTELVGEWPTKCAEHRLTLTERIANGKVALGIPTKANGSNISFKVFALSLLGAGLVIGGTIAGLGYVILKAKGLI